jgi:rhamnosyltransferase subunit B
MKIFIVTLGTWGDVRPFISIAKELTKRMHDVTFLSNSKYAPIVEKEGINFFAVSDSTDLDNSLDYIVNKGLVWEREGRKTSELQKVVNRVFEIFIKPTKSIFNFISQNYVKGETLIVSNYLCFGTRYAQEKLNIPAISVVLVPFYFRSKIQPPEQAMIPVFFPKMIKYWGEKWFNDGIFYKRMFKQYKDFDLTKYSKIENRFSPDKVFCMAPEFFANKQADWPTQTEVIGFPLEKIPADENANPDATNVIEFAKNSKKVIIFNLGAKCRTDNSLFWESVKACEKIGASGIFLGYSIKRLGADTKIPDFVRVADYISLGRILPYCDAIVHHGGIGTCAEAFRAGLPQIISPEFPEHFDTALRIIKSGVGQKISRNHYTADNLAKILDEVLFSKSIKEKCNYYSKIVGSTDTIDVVCTKIESFLDNKKQLQF